MNILGLINIRREYALHYEEPKNEGQTSCCSWISDPVNKKEELIPIAEFRKTKGYVNFKNVTRITVEF